MSIDCMIANLDRKEFLRPADMGLHSEIRSIENWPSIFHVAIARLLAVQWAGCRVAIVTDAGSPPGVPSWEAIMDRDGWTSILADVVQDLVERQLRGLTLDETIYNGSVRDLTRVLEKHVKDLKGTLDGLSADADQFGDDVGVEQSGIRREIEHAREVLVAIKKAAKQAEKADHG